MDVGASPAPSGTEPATTPPPSPEATADQEDVAAEDRTVEEVEAYWQKRQSGKDRAHAAAEEALRQQVESLQRQLEATAAGRTAPDTQESSTVRELREQLDQERTARTIADRRAKFPAAAEWLGMNSSVFATADEVDLAKVNALVDDAAPRNGELIAPTSPRKAAPPPSAKPYSEKSKEELLDDLKRISPAYDAWQRQQTG